MVKKTKAQISEEVVAEDAEWEATPLRADLIPLFVEECDKRSKEIDPDSEHDWFALTLGWAIAKGCTALEARKLAIHIRYKTPYG
jgi:hypothetical protein